MPVNKPVDGRIRKFNPGTFQSDREVIEQFVVRERELEIVLDVLRGNIDAPSCQQTLLVAPRGRGKSMLLARVAAELRTDPVLAGQLIPVRFMEESQELFDIKDFWLESLFHLANTLAASERELARALRETHRDLAGKWREDELDKRARGALLDAADRLGKQLVLMVENLQDLCQDTDEEFGWALRKALQSEHQIMLLATATTRFEELEDVHQPFFELFRVVCLGPLDAEECRRLWQVVSGDAVSAREIRPLQIFTGGNPRLLVIIADFARHRSLRQLMEELVTLIDDHTEYFRGHLDAFAKTERRVYLALIDLWQPSTTAEIAARARMDLRTVSTLLGRLVGRGTVIAQKEGRKHLYVAAERLYSIYYKLRRERDEVTVVRNLIHFMTVFYSGPELAEMSSILNAEAGQSPRIREGLARAMAELPELGALLAGNANALSVRPGGQRVKGTPPDTAPVTAEIVSALMKRDFEEVIRLADRFLASRPTEPVVSAATEAAVLLGKGIAQGQLGDSLAEIATYDQMVERFGASDAPGLQEQAARALVNKGERLIEIGRTEESLQTYDELERRFGELIVGGVSFNWRAQWGKTRALLAEGRRAAAMEAFRAVLAGFLPGNETMMRELQNGVPDMLAARASAREVLEVLSSNRAASETLAPLIIALRQTTGETVRAPSEMLEVAADIRARIEARSQAAQSQTSS